LHQIALKIGAVWNELNLKQLQTATHDGRPVGNAERRGKFAPFSQFTRVISVVAHSHLTLFCALEVIFEIRLQDFSKYSFNTSY